MSILTPLITVWSLRLATFAVKTGISDSNGDQYLQIKDAIGTAFGKRATAGQYCVEADTTD